MSAAELLLIFAAVLGIDEALTLVSSRFPGKQGRTSGRDVFCFQCGHVPVLVCLVFVLFLLSGGSSSCITMKQSICVLVLSPEHYFLNNIYKEPKQLDEK